MDATNRNASPAADARPGSSSLSWRRGQGQGSSSPVSPHVEQQRAASADSSRCAHASLASRLFSLLSTSTSLDALAANLGLSLTELLDLVDRPEVQEVIDRLQQLEDRRQESVARAVLQDIAETATDPTEKRRAATTLLRAIRGRLTPDAPPPSDCRPSTLTERDARHARDALESVLETTRRDRDVGLWHLYSMFDNKRTHNHFNYDNWRTRLNCTHLAPLLDYSHADIHPPATDAESLVFHVDLHTSDALVPLRFTMVKRDTDDGYEWRILEIRPHDTS